MGSGIAKVALLTTKAQVVLMDSNQVAVERAQMLIEKLIDGDVTKSRISAEDAAAAKSRLQTTTVLEDIPERSDFIIEAASENPQIKFEIFRTLDKLCLPSTILASNTSSISITNIASYTKRPQNVIGMHFMNPVPVMKLVEVIPGLSTSQGTQDRTLALAHQMGKTTTISRDIAGFIANRLLAPYLNEAIQALYEGLGTAEDIDTTMKLGCNMPMGPLTLADFIGLDTVLSILNILHGELGAKYKPSPLLQRYVDAGWLGKKSGRGFFKYTTDEPKPPAFGITS